MNKEVNVNLSSCFSFNVNGIAQCPVCRKIKAHFFFEKEGYPIYKCQGCDFLFTHPYPDDATLAHHYTHNYRGAQQNSILKRQTGGGVVFGVACRLLPM